MSRFTLINAGSRHSFRVAFLLTLAFGLTLGCDPPVEQDAGATDAAVADANDQDASADDAATGADVPGRDATVDTDATIGPRCGDGVVNTASEQCDGTQLQGATCATQGFAYGLLECDPGTCQYDTSLCRSVCGNGVVEGDEECDSSELNGAACTDVGYFGGDVICTPSCRLNYARCNMCGNGSLDSDEECEGTFLGGVTCTSLSGGTLTGPLGCSADCHYDTSSCDNVPAVCGNGQIETGESCDGFDLDGTTCDSLYPTLYSGGTLLCNAQCQFDTAYCSPIVTSACGNSSVDTERGEDCDGSLLQGASCTSLGYSGGSLSCRSDCTYNLSACQGAGTCGNNSHDPANGEACDGADLGFVADCLGLGFLSGSLSCTDQCTYDLSQCSNCGNGVIDPGEDCDGASALGGNICQSLGYVGGDLACGSDCRYDVSQCQACGNGRVDSDRGEICDGQELLGKTCGSEGYTYGLLSCDSTCQLDPALCTSLCGNGVAETGEECDGSDILGATCGDAGYAGGRVICSPSCMLNYSECNQCGNGTVDADEECEGTDLRGVTCAALSGGVLSGDPTCSSECRLDTSTCTGAPASCGNGSQESPEQCDGTDLGGATCTTVNSIYSDEGPLFCTSNCLFETKFCEKKKSVNCGNGRIDANEGEQCDGSNLDNNTCQTLGYPGGSLDCSIDCKLVLDGCDPPVTCGNGQLDTSHGEACDGTDLGNFADCAALGYYAGSLACTSRCSYDTSACTLCGNGVLNASAGEECDGSDFGLASCRSMGFTDGDLNCDNVCAINTDNCSTCGNSIQEGSEDCDDTDMGGSPDCAAHGYAVGAVQCTAACTYDLSGCSAKQHEIAIVSGQDQSGVINSTLAGVVIKVTDLSGSNLRGETVYFNAPQGASALPASADTNIQGRVTGSFRLGLLPGSYQFTAHTAGSVPLLINATALAPDDGVIFSSLNVDHQLGSSGVPGPASLVRVNSPWGLTSASDGTLYVSEEAGCRVLRVSPAGHVTRVLGTGVCGSSLGNFVATDAQINAPTGLALDEANDILYVSDNDNNRVLFVLLGDNLVDVYAGGGSASTEPYGDGGSATQATLLRPGQLRIGPDGDLYIMDNDHARIRRVDSGTQIISTWMQNENLPASAAAGFKGCGSGCDVVWDTVGNAFVAAQICGTDSNTNCGSYYATYGILRRSPDGSLTQVAGRYSGSSGDGISAKGALLSEPSTLAMDGAGNLFLAEYSNHRIRQIDADLGMINTVAGTGSAAGTGDGSQALLAAFNNPRAIVLGPQGQLHIADLYNHSVRTIWGLGQNPGGGRASLSMAAGDMQTVEFGHHFDIPLGALLQDGTGSPVEGAMVLWASLSPGGALLAIQSATTASGVASVSGRVGLQTGTYNFEARYFDLHGQHVSGSPVHFAVTAQAPAADTVFSVVNTDHARGNSGLPLPASVARVGEPWDVVVASDGTIYFSDYYYCYVRKVSPEGVLSNVVGAGACNDSTPDALYRPTGLALDEAGGKLYVAEYSRNTVRVIDLAAGGISAFAGGSSAPAPGYGDDGPASNAALSKPGHIRLGPDGALYIADEGHEKIRRVSMDSSHIISTWLDALGYTTLCNASNLRFIDATSDIAWAASGEAFLSGSICGTAANAGGNYGATPGVVRRDNDGSLHHVAGYQSATLDEGVSARNVTFPLAPHLAIDAAGNLYLSVRDSHRVFRVESSNGRLTTVVGTGTAGATGDYGAALAAQLNKPSGIFMDALGNLFVADYNNFTVRTIWGLGQTTPRVTTLRANGSNAGTAVVAGAFNTPLTAELTDSASALLEGYEIEWANLSLGAGLYESSVWTGATGLASVTGRVGRALEAYLFTASFYDIYGQHVSGSPVQFTVTAQAPATGTLFSPVNVDHAREDTPLPAPGNMSRIGKPWDVAVASDGTVYFTDYDFCYVRTLSPEGVLSNLVGTGSCGTGASDQLARPTGLDLDESGNKLYVAEYSRHTVRVIDLGTGAISSFAGGGTASGPSYGDGGPASSAVLSYPMHIRLGPDGALYIIDDGHDKVRRVAMDANIISTWFAGRRYGADCGTLDVRYLEKTSDIVWAASGDAYISGSICGTAANAGGNYGVTFGVVRRDSSGTLSHVAGFVGGATGESVAATTSLLNVSPSLALRGNVLVLSLSSEHRIREIGVDGNINTVIGTGTAGPLGDYGPAIDAQLNMPKGIAVTPAGDLVIADFENHSLRYVWQH